MGQRGPSSQINEISIHFVKVVSLDIFHIHYKTSISLEMNFINPLKSLGPHISCKIEKNVNKWKSI